MNAVPGSFIGMVTEEIDLIRRAIGGAKGIGVEIGCMDGWSTMHTLECSELTLVVIDPFIPDSMKPQLIGSVERFWQNVAPWKDRVALEVDYSIAVANKWLATPIDFLFIDGDHRYPSVLADFNAWSQWLKVGGVLAMHDSRVGRPNGAPYHYGPSQVAQDEIYHKPTKWELVGEAWSLTVARKLK